MALLAAVAATALCAVLAANHYAIRWRDLAQGDHYIGLVGFAMLFAMAVGYPVYGLARYLLRDRPKLD